MRFFVDKKIILKKDINSEKKQPRRFYGIEEYKND